MQHAIAHNLIHELKIAVGTHPLHFRPGSNCPQWGTDIADTAAGFGPAHVPAPAVPPAPAAPAPAAAPSPAPPTTIDVATAVANAVTAAVGSAPAPPIAATATAPASATRLQMLFNPSSLPADVRATFQHKQDRRILTQETHTPHNCPSDPCHNMHHWIDAAMEKTVCANGTVFFHMPVEEKMVMKNPVPCKKDTHAAIRRWHQTF